MKLYQVMLKIQKFAIVWWVVADDELMARQLVVKNGGESAKLEELSVEQVTTLDRIPDEVTLKQVLRVSDCLEIC